MTSDHLYIIGNGFDCYHGAKCSYAEFRKYLLRHRSYVLATFDLYFGPRSLMNSFESFKDCLRCLEISWGCSSGGVYPKTTWAENNLWWRFEEHLADLNREKVLDVLDVVLPDCDEDSDGFRYCDYYLGLDGISDMLNSCTFEMRYQLHKWINTLAYEKGFKKRLLDIDKNARFLTFNYTDFLESVYGIGREQIRYIHGSRHDRYGSLIIGHSADDEGGFKAWVKRNEHRRRYRPNLKDKRGRYFANDKLAYLAYFLKDEAKGNWRSSVRYNAVQEALGRFEDYYAINMKPTESIIAANEDFFEGLASIRKISVLGHSLSTVDMPYFDKINEAIGKDVEWEISWHSDDDIKHIEAFCRRFGISSDRCHKFKLEELAVLRGIHSPLAI